MQTKTVVFDFDNVFHPFRDTVAKALTIHLGRSVCPNEVFSGDWHRRFSVDPHEILAIADSLEANGFALDRAMLELVNELEFCGHTVQICTARSGEAFLRAKKALPKNFKISSVPWDAEKRAQKIKADFPSLDFYIDDLARNLIPFAGKGILFGRSDFMGMGIQEIAGIQRPNKADTAFDLRRILASNGCALLPPFIGLLGLAGAGKDFAGRKILDLNVGYVQTSFAATLKVIAVDLVENPAFREACDSHFKTLKYWDGVQARLEGLTVEDVVQKTSKGRDLLQFLGTEFFRTKEPGIWLQAMFRLVAHLQPEPTRLPGTGQIPGCRILVTDVRFMDEASFIENKGGALGLITGRAVPFARETYTHTSESLAQALVNDPQLDPHIVRIDNSGTEQNLQQELVSKLLKPCLLEVRKIDK